MKLFDVYPLYNLKPVKGQGNYVYDEKGQAYLDLYGGHAVISIGHAHPHYVAKLTEQLNSLGFYSNSIQNDLQIELAQKLGALSGCDQYNLFLCNSGAEANENALKMASFHNGRTKVLAFKKGQLLAAQDLLRRYQSDPASVTEPAMEQEIRRVLILPRPPAGKALVLSDSGALLRVDNRIVGSLPLVQPLLLSPESHQISVIFPEQTLNSQVEVPVGRLAELRVNRGSRAVLLTLLPAYIVLPDYHDLGTEMEHQVDDAIEHAFQSEKKSVLRRDFALRKAPELKECLNTLLCQDQLATKNDVDGLLAVRVASSTGGHKIALRLLDSATGDLAGHIEREVAPGLLLRQLQQDVTQLILDSAARTRGGLQVRTDPSGAQVYMGNRILGLTPYQRPSFTGRFELVIHKPGYDSVRQQIEVSEGRTTEVIVGMAHDLPEPPPMALRRPRQAAKRAPLQCPIPSLTLQPAIRIAKLSRHWLLTRTRKCASPSRK